MRIIETPYGSFPENYHLNKLEDLCVKKIGIQTGPFGSQLHNSDYVSIGTPILTVEHLGENRILHENIPRVTDDDRRRLSRYSVKKGDIIFSRVGSVDRRALVREGEDGWLFSGRCLRVRPDPEKLDSVFLSYLMGLPSFKEYIRKIAVGATMPSINTKILSDIPICYPPLPTQHAISCILGSLDDKIELNRKMNETLEAMARAIFKSWFVDFDPVQVKAEGRQPLGMGPETSALFPERFEDSEIGEIPLGWKIEPFEKILHHSTERIGSGQAVEYSATVTGLTLRDERFNKQLSKTREKNKKIVKGDLVFGLSRKIVNFGLMKENIGSVSPVYEIFKVNSDVYIPELLEMQIRYDMSNYIDILKPSAREGQAIDREYLLSKVVLVPDMQVQKKYYQIYSIHQQKIENNEQQSRTLAQIRDALLPKLMSGEIRVDTPSS